MTVADRGIAALTSADGAGDVATLLRDQLMAATPGRLVSASAEIAPLDPVTLVGLVAGSGEDAVLWQPADGDDGFVGVGAAWSIEASGSDRFATVGSAWRALLATAGPETVAAVPGGPSGPRLMGAFGFADEAAVEPVWAGFERARFVLPAITIEWLGGRTWLRFTHVRDAEDDAEVIVDRLARRWRELASALPAVEEDDAEGALRIIASEPGIDAWEASVARIAGAVGRGRLDKAVLTRSVALAAEAPISIPAVLRRLRSAATGTTVFAVSRGSRTFLGATPERLIRVEGGTLTTMAMAGSAPRGSSAAEDERLATRLLESDKEREEHAVVVAMLRQTLAPLAEGLRVPAAPDVARFGRIQHLVTPIDGRVDPDRDVLDLVERLHPTPAVAGTPTDLALELIADEERHERGWYAGPIGWVDAAGDGDFWVALRSGVVEGASASLLAGCGIVADSDPRREWDESLVKLRALGAALGRVER